MFLLLAMTSADARTVTFTHRPVEPGERVEHLTQMRILNRDLVSEQHVTFWIPQHDQALHLKLDGFIDRAGHPRQKHPLNEQVFALEASPTEMNFVPYAGESEDQVLEEAVLRMVSLTAFGEAFDGVKLTVGEPVPTTLVSPIMRQYLGIEHGSLAMTYQQIEKGKRGAAVLEVAMDLPDGPPLIGTLRLDRKTARVLELNMSTIPGETDSFSVTEHATYAWSDVVPEPTPPKGNAPARLSDERLAEVVPKVRTAFDTLRDQGFLALMDAGFSQDDALYELSAEEAKTADSHWAYAYSTSQDLERAGEQGQLWIGFGTHDPDRAREAGVAIVGVFEAQGFPVVWDGRHSTRPMVDLHE